jgi:hypothetical protein
MFFNLGEIMKYLLAMLFVSNLAFGQYNDGFHTEPEITCTTGACLWVDDRPIELIEKVDREGFKYSELNTDSSIIDILEGNYEICFSGMDTTNLKAIIDALVGNTNAYYVSGGHFAVESYEAKNTDEGFTVILNVESDYRPYNYTLTKRIFGCGGCF